VCVPSGKVNFGLRSRSANKEIIINPEQHEFYYHERLLIPELEKSHEEKSNPKATYGFYLVDVPLEKHK